MTPNRVTVAVEKYRSQIPKGYESKLRSDLEPADDRCMDEFMFLPIKRKGKTLALAFFFGQFGFDHFYIGSYKKGILKLSCTLIAMLVSNGGTSDASAVATVFGIISAFWCLIDIFKNPKRVALSNYYALSAYLDNHHYKEISPSEATAKTAARTGTQSTAKSTTSYGSRPSTTSSTYTPKTTAAKPAASAKAMPSNAKYDPVRVAPTAKAPVASPTIDDAMKAYTKATESKQTRLSLDDLADLTAAKSTLAASAGAVAKAAESVKPAKSNEPKKIDLTFSNINVDLSLAKDLGFEDFDESMMGGARNGR